MNPARGARIGDAARPPQTTGMVASQLPMANLDWAVADYTTLCRRQEALAVQIPYRRADGPLNLPVDSTGIKFPGDWMRCLRAVGESWLRKSEQLG